MKATILIPAHNEELAIGRLLDGLLADAEPDEFDVLVLCNGCTDRTVEIARSYQPRVRVVDLPAPSKRDALRYGNDSVRVFPCLYVDSDVEVGTADVRALIGALDESTLVAAPTRRIPRDGVSRLVRAYYDVWEQLPQVHTAPFGRGVVAVSQLGYERIRTLPPVMSDDLAMAVAFDAEERAIVDDAHVVIRPPRTVRDLLRRRVRVNTGNAQLEQLDGRPADIRTSSRDLVEIARERPFQSGKLLVFLGVTVVSRIASRRRIKAGDFTTWLRDESSRETKR